MDSENPAGHPVLWEGPAQFFDGKEAKARSVSVTLDPEGLQIQGGGAYGANGGFRPDELRLLEKHGGGFFQIELLPLPGSMLEFRDPLALRGFEILKYGSRPTFTGLSLAGKAGVLTAVLVLISVFMYFYGLDMAVDGAMKVIPPQADRMLGDAVVATFDEKTLVPKDSTAVRALERSTDAIRAMGANPTDSIRILIVADTSIKNAFAFPGGTILVYTGMLRLMESQEEWFGLLAHETGHVKLRHGMHGIVRGSILGIGMSLLFGDMSGISAVILDNAGTLLRLKYGREDEAAADAFAGRRMAALGFSPEGLARLFRKFLELEKQPKWAAFLSTHPATEARIEKLMRSAQEKAKPVTRGGRYSLTPEEWTALRKL